MARDKENQKRLAREWYLRNRELAKARAKAWVEANLEKRSIILKTNRDKHKESRSAYNREWFAKNPQKRAAYEGKRRAMLLQRTPKWLDNDDLWLIEEVYDLAQLRSEAFGFEWHVDHVIPLQGKRVSGLHDISNLQVITGSENCKKHTRFTI